MTKPHEAPVEAAPEPSAFERMKEFTRRLIAVPKTELAQAPRGPEEQPDEIMRE